VENIFKKYKPDTCFHLAAQAIVGKANQSPLPTFESNIRGTWNVLEVARNKGIGQMIIASSDKAYGEHEKLPYTEDFSLSALHPYDASKACCDILARTYAHTYDLPIAVTRCANIYGGGDLNFSRIIPDTIRSVLYKRNPIIRSDGTPLRDYIYIEDVVNAYLVLAEKLDDKKIRGQAFNFGTARPISVLNLVTKIIDISGKTSLKPVVKGKGKVRGEIDEQYLSSQKAGDLLGWRHRVSIEEGLSKTIDWYRQYFANA
ncbi:GDP-mannose 4,6-dehydratase, partial [bacterium]|nr:GDP-mannose 4,6-dehydratase [bacterium]